MSVIADICLAAIFVAAFAYWYSKGLIKSVWKIAALIATVILVMFLKDPVADYIGQTKVAENINNSLSQVITVPPGGGVNIAENLNLPEVIQDKLQIGIDSSLSAADAIKNAAANALTGAVINIGVCVALFILIRLILMVVYIIIDSAVKLPILKGTNKFLGGLLGVVNMLFIVFLALMLLAMYAPSDSGLYEIINNSYLVRFLYNNNILLKLFIR